MSGKDTEETLQEARVWVPGSSILTQQAPVNLLLVKGLLSSFQVGSQQCVVNEVSLWTDSSLSLKWLSSKFERMTPVTQRAYFQKFCQCSTTTTSLPSNEAWFHPPQEGLNRRPGWGSFLGYSTPALRVLVALHLLCLCSPAFSSLQARSSLGTPAPCLSFTFFLLNFSWSNYCVLSLTLLDSDCYRCHDLIAFLVEHCLTWIRYSINKK